MNYDAQGVNIMSNEEFFKIQAKNLLHDYQTFTAENVSESEVEKFTSRESKLFSGDLFYYFGLDKTDDFTLMKAQHIVAQIAGSKNWVELKHSSEKEKELARLVFTNTNNSADILKKDIVYNNFPWCNFTDNQKSKIKQTAQAILDARAK